MGFSVGKSPNEQVERGEIERIKLDLKEKFKNQSFSLKALQLLYPGESDLSLLFANARLSNIHINLVYALVELSQQNRLKLIDSSSMSFSISDR